MMMLTIDQLSYLLKFALQKMKQPGVSILYHLLSYNYIDNVVLRQTAILKIKLLCLFSILT